MVDNHSSCSPQSQSETSMTSIQLNQVAFTADQAFKISTLPTQDASLDHHTSFHTRDMVSFSNLQDMAQLTGDMVSLSDLEDVAQVKSRCQDLLLLYENEQGNSGKQTTTLANGISIGEFDECLEISF